MATKTLKIRIKDSTACKGLNRMARAINFVWNYCNETSFEAVRKNSQWLSYQDLQKLTKGANKELGLNSASVQMVCREYVTRRRQFKKRKLRWRGRKSLGWIPFRHDCIKFKDGIVTFNKKSYKLFQPERLPESDYKSGEFCQDSRGRWYVCIPIEYEPEQYDASAEVGIDLGLKDVATLSSGKKVSNGRYYRMMERKLSRAQKHKKKRQARKIHAKIRNKRMDDLHKASTEIVQENGLIVVGKFGAKGLAKTKMAKSVNDAATTAFKTMLKYKASAQQHRIFVEVPENFSTQICSSCEEIPDSAPKGVKDLGVREWVCSSCRAVHDRDVNAAMNILRFGRESLVPKVAQESPTIAASAV